MPGLHAFTLAVNRADIDISVIIPVIHEGTHIRAAVQRLWEQRFYGGLEVIVTDGDPKGSTIRHVRPGSALTLVSPPGRGRQMNAGAEKASGRILLFLHCDTVLPENGLDRAVHILADPRVSAGAFDLAIDAKGAAYRMIEKTASLRSRVTRIPYGDQAIFIRKSAFFRIGRFKEIPLMEDVELMQRIKKRKMGLRFVNGRVLTSSRRWEKEGKLYTTLRNWMIRMMYAMGQRPEKLVRFYRNHASGRKN